MEDFLPGVEGNDEQLLSRYGKKIRLAGGGKQNYSNHINRRVASTAICTRNYERSTVITSDQLLSDRIFHAEDEIYHVNGRPTFKSRGKRIDKDYQPDIFMLGSDELERVCYFLDTKSAVNLLLSCKKINEKLSTCTGFWHQLCKNENFHEYSALKLEDEIVNTPYSITTKSKKRVTFKETDKTKNYLNNKTNNSEVSELQERISWSGEKFHDVTFPSDATHWRKIYLRGLQMRRNICNGRFELWRLFLTDEDHLPVKKMTSNTTFRELR